MKTVVYEVFDPSGKKQATFANRKDAKEYVNRKNQDTPSWHYDELWKIGASVVNT